MKKKILFISAIVCFVAIAGANMLNNSSKENISNLLSENIEALADGESNCNNRNGFRQFTGTTDPDDGAYDCCHVWRQGVGSGKCR